MARVFRQRYTRPLPPGAKVEMRKGSPCVRIAGKWLTVNAARTRYTCLSKTWYAEYRDENGIPRIESTRCTDEEAARAVLAAIQRRVELVRAGVLSPATAAASQFALDPLQTHVDTWLRGLQALGRSTSYRNSCRVITSKLAREIGWTRLIDLTYEAFDKWIRDTGKAARSRNAYREVLVAFCSWCCETHRLTSNPFLAFPVANVDADPRRPRRAFTDAELGRLLEATERRSPGRALAYRIMALTGLRVGELRSLRVCDYDGASLHLAARDAKNGAAAALPVRSDLRTRLDAWCAGRDASAPLIELPKKLTRRLDGDMAAAGIAKTAGGRTLDVHSLRKTFGTALARAGVPPRVSMQLMRHSSMHLTMKLYTDPTLLATAEAVEKLSLPE